MVVETSHARLSEQSPGTRPGLLLFAAGGVPFGLPLPAIVCTAYRPALVAPPTRPPFLDGFFNFRGSTCACVSLAALLSSGERGDPGFYAPLIVLRPGPTRVALRVDALTQTLDGRHWQPLDDDPDHSYDGCIACLGDTGSGQPVNVIDTAKLLLREERSRIEALGKLVAERLERVS